MQTEAATETRHTPGPWMLQPASFSPRIYVLRVDATADEAAVAEVIDRANAHLIAAAPEMYEALASVQKLIAEGAKTGFNPLDGDWAERLFVSQQKTSAALSKARGEA
jgi:hypothetical protein